MRWIVFAHTGGPLTPHNLWGAWEPSLLIPLGVTVLIYGWGIRNVWRRAGAGHGIPVKRFMSFVGGILALAVALVSPLDALSGSLFSAHMAQHLILTLVAAPLLVLSDFPLALLWALPRRSAQAFGYCVNRSHPISRAWRVISSPISAWLLFAIPIWVWHTTTFYEATLRNQTIHALEHLIFLGTAMLFWWALFKPSGPYTRPVYLHYGMAIPYLFTTALQSGILGALMTFTTQPWYPYYNGLTSPWGLTPLQDQQLAGLIMWIPLGAVFTLLTIGYFAAWFRALEQRSERPQGARLQPPEMEHKPW